MNIYNFENAILEPTRISTHSTTLILKSNNIRAVESGILEVDRKATFISISCNYNSKCAYKRKICLYKNAGFNRLNQLITEYNWNEIIINAPSGHQALEQFTCIFNELYRLCVPENNDYDKT